MRKTSAVTNNFLICLKLRNIDMRGDQKVTVRRLYSPDLVWFEGVAAAYVQISASLMRIYISIDIQTLVLGNRTFVLTTRAVCFPRLSLDVRSLLIG